MSVVAPPMLAPGAPLPPLAPLAPLYAAVRPITVATADHFFWQPTFDAQGNLLPPPADLALNNATPATYFLAAPAPSVVASSSAASAAASSSSSSPAAVTAASATVVASTAGTAPSLDAADSSWGRLARLDPTPSEVAAILDARFSSTMGGVERIPLVSRSALERDVLDALSCVQREYSPEFFEAVLRFWRAKHKSGVYNVYCVFQCFLLPILLRCHVQS